MNQLFAPLTKNAPTIGPTSVPRPPTAVQIAISIDAAGAWTYTASSEHNEFADGTTDTYQFPVAYRREFDSTVVEVDHETLGPLTLPHMLVRLVVAEQLYPAASQLANPW